MPATAKKHFDEDISRATAILKHAKGLPHKRKPKKLIRDDLIRSSWMYGVGALDAYFCDAYADLVARILKAKNDQQELRLTDSISNITFPVSAIFAQTNVRENWKWRLAARDMIEKDNVLAVKKIKTLFNPFMRETQKLFSSAVIDNWVLNRRAPRRLVAISATEYRLLSGKDLKTTRTTARNRISQRYDEISQRRHDCIHNCDRPKLRPQTIIYSHAEKAIADVKFLVDFCDEHFETEFNQYLRTAGATAVVRNNAGFPART